MFCVGEILVYGFGLNSISHWLLFLNQANICGQHASSFLKFPVSGKFVCMCLSVYLCVSVSVCPRPSVYAAVCVCMRPSVCTCVRLLK